MNLIPLLKEAARSHNIDLEILAALVLQESSANVFATRYEPRFFEKYIGQRSRADLGGFWLPYSAPLDGYERVARSTSWGLCQVMGQVAREMGFRKPWLHSLLEPKTNLHYGAKKLAREITRRGSLEGGLLAYNGGGNSLYVSFVLARLKTGEVERFLKGETKT